MGKAVRTKNKFEQPAMGSGFLEFPFSAAPGAERNREKLHVMVSSFQALSKQVVI